MSRCIACGSADILFVDHEQDGTGIRCLDCGALDDRTAVFPELDALDELLAYYGDAPLGEPPAELEPAIALRKPAALETLTAREVEISRLVADGLANKEIGWKLRISEQTVKNHLVNIFAKLGVSGRVSLAVRAIGGSKCA